MPQLTYVWELVMRFVLGAFAAVVVVQLLSGGIKTRHLLYGDHAGGSQYFSPGRVQLLMVTTLVALNYVATVIQNTNRTALPDVDTSVLALLFGSHAIYLGGKARALLFGASRKGE